MGKRVNKPKRYTYIIAIYELKENNVLGERKFLTERKLKLPPEKDAAAYGKPIKSRTQRGWTAVELAPDKRGRREIVLYRRKGSGKNPRLIERFWRIREED